MPARGLYSVFRACGPMFLRFDQRLSLRRPTQALFLWGVPKSIRSEKLGYLRCTFTTRDDAHAAARRQ